MEKIDVGIVMGHILDSGITVDRIKSIGIPIEEMIETGGTITKQDIYKISRKIGCDISLLMRKKQRRSEGIKHNFEPNIFSKRVQELGWTDVCLNNVCTHASNVIRSLKRGVDIDTLHNYELVNICFMLECDPLYLRGRRKEPTVCSSVYVVPQNRSDFKKVDSRALYRLITENVGLESFGVDKTDTSLSILEKISVELKTHIGCSKKYAYSLLTSNIKIPKFVMNKLVAFTKSSEDMLTYKENRIPPITSKDTPEKDAVDDLKTITRENDIPKVTSSNQNIDERGVVEVDIPIVRNSMIDTSDKKESEPRQNIKKALRIVKEKSPKEFDALLEKRKEDSVKRQYILDTYGRKAKVIAKACVTEKLESVQKNHENVIKENNSESTSINSSSFIDRIFQILDLMVDYPEFANITRQLLKMSDEEKKKVISFISSAFDLLS